MRFYTHRLAVALTLALLCPVAGARERPLPKETRQLVVVTTPSWSATTGTLRRFARDGGGPWRPVGDPRAVVVGKSGLGWGRGLHPDGASALGGPRKHEGDGRAPAGIFALLEMTGYAAAPPPGATLSYQTATEGLRCVDDASSPVYNQIALENTTDPCPHWTSDESMLRDDNLYELAVVVEHNRKPTVPGDGSCIFLHVWRGAGAPTVGCTAMPLPELRELVSWLDVAAHPLLVQLPAAVHARLAARWALPKADQ